MAYAGPNDIRAIKAISPTLKGYGVDEEAQNTAIQAVIDRVEVIINTRLQSKYTVPLLPVPDILKRISVYKTAYEILVENYGDVDGKYSYFRREADALLQQIEDGSISFTPPAESINGVDCVIPTGDYRVFELG